MWSCEASFLLDSVQLGVGCSDLAFQVLDGCGLLPPLGERVGSEERREEQQKDQRI